MNEPSPLADAQRRFADALPRAALGAERCLLEDALGRIVAEDVIAPSDMPPYHRAIVEGFLVRTSDTAAAGEGSSVEFTIVGEVRPGDERCPEISPRQALQVATGSLCPDGPYSVVRMWEAARDGARFTITRPFPPRFFIEERGCDLKEGTAVVRAGAVVGPAEIGAIAALGIAAVPVSRRPRVTVFASGDELVPYSEPLRPGAMRDSNSVMLAAAVRQAGGIPTIAGIMSDHFGKFVSAVRAALEQADMIVISGGTAAGGRDFISDLVRELGELIVDGVPMRSGRPLIMGVAQDRPIVCVAGHPPEALRGFRLFGAAAIDRLTGRDAPLPEDA